MTEFYAVVDVNGDVYAQPTRKEALALMIADGDRIYECTPLAEVMRDITEECAREWFDGVTDIYDGVPEWASEFVGRDAQDRIDDYEEKGSRRMRA